MSKAERRRRRKAHIRYERNQACDLVGQGCHALALVGVNRRAYRFAVAHCRAKGLSDGEIFRSAALYFGGEILARRRERGHEANRAQAV